MAHKLYFLRRYRTAATIAIKTTITPLIPTFKSVKGPRSAAAFVADTDVPLFPAPASVSAPDVGDALIVDNGAAVELPVDMLGPSSFRSSPAEDSKTVRLHKPVVSSSESPLPLAYA